MVKRDEENRESKRLKANIAQVARDGELMCDIDFDFHVFARNWNLYICSY